MPIFVPTITMFPADRLNPAPYNPRRISPKKLNALKASITIYGFIEPMVVQRKGRVIVGGHARYTALRELCLSANEALPKVPCYMLDLTDRQAKKLNIALNNVGGDFDAKLLADLIANLEREEKISPEETMLMGMDDEEVLRHLKTAQPDKPMDDDNETSSFASSVSLSIKFDSVTMRDNIKNLLAAKAEREKITTGQALASLLNVK